MLAASRDESDTGWQALEMLCRAYWYPIYVYVRRRGHGPEEAQDLTQEFFAQLINKHHLRLADQTKGKFRTFLLTGLELFLGREWNRAHRQKRGGQITFISLDQQAPEERYQLEPAEQNTPEKQFLRQWALTVLKQTTDALEHEGEAGGKGALFRETRGVLSGAREAEGYAAMGQRLGMTEGAMRAAVHRLRRRYGELLRQEIAHTVEKPEEVEEEMRFLLKALSE